MLNTSVYLVLEPEYGRYRYNEDEVVGFKVAKMTKSRPHTATGPVVKIGLNLPDTAFKPFSADLQLDIPESALDMSPTLTAQVEGLQELKEYLS